MPTDPGPLQTDVWPLRWGDLNQRDLPSWVIWHRVCQRQDPDGQPCPRRMTGTNFGLRYCDRHWPADVPIALGKFIG
jgi:hypothetical protein